MTGQRTVRIGVAQFTPSADPGENLATLAQLTARAAAAGAAAVIAPEGAIVRFLDDPDAAVRAAEPLSGPFVTGIRQLSTEYRITVVAGTFTDDGPNGTVHNTLVVARDGELVARYRKVHLYDAFSFLESDRIAAGAEPPPVVEVDGIRLGLATCYDLRFPEIFRVLLDQGAQVLALPAAWVAGPLKEEHFLTLLKARAIENTCYVLAADQAGPRAVGRSGAFDPSGLPLVDLGSADVALGLVDIDPDRLDSVRHTLPAARHRRFAVSADPTPARSVPGR